MTTKEVLDLFLSFNEMYLSKGTKSYYRSRGAVVAAYFKDKDFATLTRKDVYAFMRSRIDAGVKNNTVNKDLTLIKTLIKHVLAERPFSISQELEDQYAKIKAIKKLKADTTSYNDIPEDLYSKLTDYINDESYVGPEFGLRHLTKIRNRFLLEMCLHSGVRREEMVHIKFSDVDYDKHTITLKHTKANGERVIPVTEVMESLLKLLYEKAPSEYILMNYHCGTQLTNDGINCVFNKEISKILGFKVTTHMCRHTFATNAINHDIPIITLMKVMGHKDLKTTMLYYTNNQSKIISDTLNCIQY